MKTLTIEDATIHLHPKTDYGGAYASGYAEKPETVLKVELALQEAGFESIKHIAVPDSHGLVIFYTVEAES